jgi:C1A family cysteine protease
VTTKRHIKRYGWIRDLPDERDKVTAPPSGETLARIAATPVVDLSTSPFMPPIWNQGQLGSCTAHSVGAAYEFAALASGVKVSTPSRLYIYYQERVIEGTVAQDSGASLRDGFKVLAAGVPPETDWPYDITKFELAAPPQAVADAAQHPTTVYQTVPQTRLDLQAQLVQDKPRPISIGFTVYESFESSAVAATGVVPMPSASEAVLGGHAVLVCGYDEPNQRYKLRNSWGSKDTDGTQWGIDGEGYFYLPYSYLEDPNLADDFWAAEVAA